MNINNILKKFTLTVVLISSLILFLLSTDLSIRQRIGEIYSNVDKCLKKHNRKLALEELKTAFLLDPANDFIFHIHYDICSNIVIWVPIADLDNLIERIKTGKIKNISEIIDAEMAGTNQLRMLVSEKLKTKLSKREQIFYQIVKGYCFLVTVEHGGTPPKMEMIQKAKKIFTEISNDTDKDIALNGYIGLIETLANEYAYQGKARQGERIALQTIIEKYPDSFYAAKSLLSYAFTFHYEDEKKEADVLLKIKKMPNYKLYYVIDGAIKYDLLHDIVDKELKKLKD